MWKRCSKSIQGWLKDRKPEDKPKTLDQCIALLEQYVDAYSQSIDKEKPGLKEIDGFHVIETEDGNIVSVSSLVAACPRVAAALDMSDGAQPPRAEPRTRGPQLPAAAERPRRRARPVVQLELPVRRHPPRRRLRDHVL